MRWLLKMDEELRPKRSYDNSLRMQQQELTYEAIMSAVRALILEGHLYTFTIQEVADRAGVSYGTVYRRFPSREAILEGLVRWGGDFGMKNQPPYPDRLEDLPGWVEKTIQVFIPLLPVADAIAPVVSAVNQGPSPSRDRDELFARLVKQAAPELSETQQKAVTVGLRVWVSIRTWGELYTRHGLNAETMIFVVKEGIRAQIELMKIRAAEARKG
jgi:AcrR family transcriptional regulator